MQWRSLLAALYTTEQHDETAICRARQAAFPVAVGACPWESCSPSKGTLTTGSLLKCDSRAALQHSQQARSRDGSWEGRGAGGLGPTSLVAVYMRWKDVELPPALATTSSQPVNTLLQAQHQAQRCPVEASSWLRLGHDRHNKGPLEWRAALKTEGLRAKTILSPAGRFRPDYCRRPASQKPIRLPQAPPCPARRQGSAAIPSDRRHGLPQVAIASASWQGLHQTHRPPASVTRPAALKRRSAARRAG